MKTKKITMMWAMPALVIIFFMAGCSMGEDGPGNPPLEGSITFTNLPPGYSLFSCDVSSNPTPQWSYNSGGAVTPEYDAWYPSIIGRGWMNGGNMSIAYTKYVKLNGVWVTDNSSSDFDFTGPCGVYLTLYLPGGNYMAFNLGLDNVQFTKGRAEIDLGSINLLPPTDGLFTLTGAEEYNGKYAFLVGAADTSIIIYGFREINSFTMWKGFPISDGRAEIPLYFLTGAGDTNFKAYDRTEIPQTLIVYIIDKEGIDYSNPETAWKGATSIAYMNTSTFNSGVQFTGGIGTASVSDENATIVVLP